MNANNLQSFRRSRHNLSTRGRHEHWKNTITTGSEMWSFLVYIYGFKWCIFIQIHITEPLDERA